MAVYVFVILDDVVIVPTENACEMECFKRRPTFPSCGTSDARYAIITR